MDYRLDLYNSVRNYSENAGDEDVLMIVAHNKKDGDTFTSFVGDWQILSGALTTEGYMKFDEGTNEQFEIIRRSILNMAYNICMADEKIKETFKSSLI